MGSCDGVRCARVHVTGASCEQVPAVSRWQASVTTAPNRSARSQTDRSCWASNVALPLHSWPHEPSSLFTSSRMMPDGCFVLWRRVSPGGAFETITLTAAVHSAEQSLVVQAERSGAATAGVATCTVP